MESKSVWWFNIQGNLLIIWGVYLFALHPLAQLLNWIAHFMAKNILGHEGVFHVCKHFIKLVYLVGTEYDIQFGNGLYR